MVPSTTRLALNGSFTIFYIIGDAASGGSGADWARLPGLAGVTHVFASPTEVCDNCGAQEHQAHLVTSTSPVTSLLLDYVEAGRLASMEAADVEPFLVEKLRWRVQTVSPRSFHLPLYIHEGSSNGNFSFADERIIQITRPRARLSTLAGFSGIIRSGCPSAARRLLFPGRSARCTTRSTLVS